MNAVATPTIGKKPRARSPMPESTERPFRGRIARETAPAPVATTPTAPAMQSTDNVLCEVGGVLNSAMKVFSAWEERDTLEPSLLGLLFLMERIERFIDDVDVRADHSDPISGVFPDLSHEFYVAAEVGRVFPHAVRDDLILWAVINLLEHCKHLVDVHVDALTAARARNVAQHV